MDEISKAINFQRKLLNLAYKEGLFNPEKKRQTKTGKLKILVDQLHDQHFYLKETRKERRSVCVATFRDKFLNKTRMLISGRIPTPIITFGKELKASRKKRGARWSTEITVGYMWKEKVHANVYSNIRDYYLGYFIMSAERRRINSDKITLYEVVAYNVAKNDFTTGYVAITKNMSGYFAKDAHRAIRKAEISLQRDIGRFLTGKVK